MTFRLPKLNWLKLILVSGFVLLLGSIFYFSWLPNPSFENETYLPAWLISWTDNNDNIRTAVPFVFLGYFGGKLSNLQLKFSHLALWGVVFLVIILIAELGQFNLPQRHFDWADIMWGVLGGYAGVALVLILNRFVRDVE
jgi:glycopeptide antibiotics resistance protein